MLNNISVMGRFTKNPEIRYLDGETPVLSFCLACDRDYKAKGGEKITDFIDCQAWKNTAEYIAKYFSKGQLCTVTGRLQTRPYKDKNGNNRKAVEILVEHIYFADSKKEAADTGSSGDDGGFYPTEEIDDDDLPF